MTDRVPASDIERIVGATRDPDAHLGRVVTAAQRVFILHSAACLAAYPDLRACPFSRVLDTGVGVPTLPVDRPVRLMLLDSPVGPQLRGEVL